MRCKKEGDYSGLTVLGGYSLLWGKWQQGQEASYSIKREESLTQGVLLGAHFP